jgi:hypothetical protein
VLSPNLRLARCLVLFVGLWLGSQAFPQSDPLPSWNEGPAKQAIISLVKDTWEDWKRIFSWEP